jgi:hypothetical protein
MWLKVSQPRLAKYIQNTQINLHLLLLFLQVRLSFCSADDIARMLNNYITRDRVYTEEFRNCQAFAADFFGFLAAKKDVTPTVKVNKMTYVPRSHMFLYDPAKFHTGQNENVGGSKAREVPAQPATARGSA